MKYLIIVSILIVCVNCRLLFPKGSDVGYVVSDDDKRNDADIIADEIAHHKRSNLVKRAFDPNLHNTVNLESSNNEDASDKIPEELKDEKHGVKMGVKNVRCDNGLVNLTMDWDDSPVEHTCYTPKRRLKINKELDILYHCDEIPHGYFPQHKCMSIPLEYNSTLPTFGFHRPLWPLWGEYVYVPPQRWLHALEHGAVVMLYHPCTEPSLVNELKDILTGCIFKHVISPYNLLPEDRPLTLIVWGCYMQMSAIDEEKVKDFIKEKALHGPEGKYPKLGKYTYGLIEKAVPPMGSNENDTIICPS